MEEITHPCILRIQIYMRFQLSLISAFSKHSNEYCVVYMLKQRIILLADLDETFFILFLGNGSNVSQ